MPTQAEQIINKSVMELYRRYWAERNNAILVYWDFFLGRHKNHLPAFKEETDQDYADRKKGAVIENHCKTIVNTQIGFLYGGEVSRWVEDRKTGKASDYWQEFFEERVWRYNDITNFMLAVAAMQGITGFCMVTKKPAMMDNTNLAVKEKSSIEKNGVVKYDLLDSITCMPLPKLITYDEGETFEIEERDFAALIKVYRFDNFTGSWIINRELGNVFTQWEYIEYIDSDRWIKWKKTYAGDYKETKAFREQKGQENPYGSIKIPFTLFQNPGDPMKLEGESDIHDTIPLNIHLNERLTDDKNTLNYASFPVFLTTGMLPKGWKIKPGAALELPEGTDAKWLTWEGDLEASIKHQEITRENIRRISSTSDLSLSGMETGQLRSGTGLKGKFATDILRAKLKRPLVEASEKELMLSTMAMFSWMTGKPFNRLDWEIHVDFPEDVLGLDKMTEAQVEKMEYDLGVKGLRDLIIKLRPEIAGDEEAINALIKEHQKKQKEEQQKEEPGFKKNFEQENVEK